MSEAADDLEIFRIEDMVQAHLHREGRCDGPDLCPLCTPTTPHSNSEVERE